MKKIFAVVSTLTAGAAIMLAAPAAQADVVGGDVNVSVPVTVDVSCLAVVAVTDTASCQR